MPRLAQTLCAVLLVLLAGACSGGRQDDGPVVLAAASLQDALQDAADSWTAQGHAPPVLSFAGTSALARQIEAGAPADLFISADEEWMDEVEGKGLVSSGSRTDFLANSLVLIAPAGSKADLAIAPDFPLAEALGQGRLALADPDAVPAGRYARQALTSLNVWASVADRIAQAENVRAALALVARGEAPLGIVYATDAKAEPRVRVLGPFPSASHVQITYPLAILGTSTNPETQDFRDFLLSEAGVAIFRKYGFRSPEGR